MKTLIKSVALTFAGILAFSFTDKEPKVVIVDIVDHIETTNNQNLTQSFRQSIETLNQSDDVKVLEWKTLTSGLDEAKKQALLDSIQPEVVLTVSFKNATKAANQVTAVVSKNNKHFDHSLETARELTASFDQAVVQNEGVFQAASDYVQDNAVPAMFVNIETKNDQPSNTAIVSTLTEFIQKVDVVKEETTAELNPEAVESTTPTTPKVDVKIE